MGRVMAYVENNLVRAGMVECAEDFEWSSAGAHRGRIGAGAMLDMEWWQSRWTTENWRGVLLERAELEQELRAIRRATYTGRPLGSKPFVAGLEEKLGRRANMSAATLTQAMRRTTPTTPIKISKGCRNDPRRSPPGLLGPSAAPGPVLIGSQHKSKLI